VPGLRREEVASLAGVSVEYYKRRERGKQRGQPAVFDNKRVEEYEVLLDRGTWKPQDGEETPRRA